MKIKRFILAVQISFLLALFGATTFYFQYVSVRKAVEAASRNQKTEKNACSQPLTEEESEAQTNAEEEQNDVRPFHELKFVMSEISFSMIGWATVHLSVFEEIHFEVITPPPQA